MLTPKIQVRLTGTLFACLLFLLACLPLSTAGERGVRILDRVADLSHASGKIGAYRALIIGINEYADENIPDLQTAVNDARAIDRVLRKKYGFKTRLLLDGQATRKAIYSVLRDYAVKAKAGDSIFIYYAGHGDLDRAYNDGWWIPADATGGDPTTYLDNVQVQKAMRRMKARHVLLVSDSCYSGTLFGRSRALPPVINDRYYLNLYNEKSRWGMTSGNKTPVSDSGTGGHSVFAYHLLKALRNNAKPYLSTQEIYTAIAPIVSNNSEQTPLCRPIRNTGDQGGAFVFVASLSTPAAAMPAVALPPQLPESGDIGDFERVIKERRAAKQQWARWQMKMEANYKKARQYDESGELTRREKKEVWQAFLAAYSADNPHDTRDNRLREQAGERRQYWAQIEPGILSPAAPDIKKVPPNLTTKIPAAPVKAFYKLNSPLQSVIRKRGTLRVGFESGYLPFEMTDKKGRFIGFDIDLATELANAMGVRLVMVNTAWDGIIPALLTKKFDVILSGMTITRNRALKVDFTEPYIILGQTILLNKKHAGMVHSYKDLNTSRYTVTSRMGTTGEQAVKRLIPKARYKAFESEAEAARAVLSGKAEAFVYDLTYCAGFMARQGQGRLVFLDKPFTREPVGIAIRKGDPEMLAWLNSILAQIKKDGRHAQIYNRWIASADWLQQIQ